VILLGILKVTVNSFVFGELGSAVLLTFFNVALLNITNVGLSSWRKL